MSDFDEVMDIINQGRISPMPKHPSKEDPLKMVTLPGEKIRWFGKLDAGFEMYGRSSVDIIVGASSYRLIFFLEMVRIIKSRFYCRSYWFNVDLENTIWHHKKGLRKREYNSLHLAPPVYKKGLVSKEIIINNIATRVDGEQENTFECTLSGLKWLNPQTKKFEGGKAEQLHQQIMGFYNQRQPVPFQVICALITNPDLLEDDLFETEPEEGQTIQEDARVEKPIPAPKPKTKPAPSEKSTKLESAPPAQTADKKEDKKPAFKWKKAASTALDVGSKIKGGLEVIGKAASAAAASGAESIKEITEKGAETVKKAGESIRETAQEAFSERAVNAGSSVGICAACGTPMRSGSLFCGKCGQKVTDRVVEEMKDHIKGKAEDFAVGKAKSMLDEEEKSSTPVQEDLRAKTISKSDLPVNITNPLKEAGIKTLGDLADQVKADPAVLGKIKGIGPASIGKIKKAIADVPLKAAPPPTVKQAKCRKCGKPVQTDWSFCPHCQEPVINSCPQCGVKIQEGWAFCPMCKTKLE